MEEHNKIKIVVGTVLVAGLFLETVHAKGLTPHTVHENHHEAVLPSGMNGMTNTSHVGSWDGAAGYGGEDGRHGPFRMI